MEKFELFYNEFFFAFFVLMMLGGGGGGMNGMYELHKHKHEGLWMRPKRSGEMGVPKFPFHAMGQQNPTPKSHP